jgi:uncharacterized DUF497 family protein
VKVAFDPVKRLITLQKRGIDFATDAEKVFAGDTATMVDKRFDYGEVREITVGWLKGHTVMMVWTQRGEVRHIISMVRSVTSSR